MKSSKYNKNGKICQWTGAVCVLAVLFSFVREASAIYAYLPMIGAPEIRMQVVTTNSFNYLAFSQNYSALQAKMAEALSNATELAASAENTNNSNGSKPISASAEANSNSKAGAGNVAGGGVNGAAGANTYISTSPEPMSDDEKNGQPPSNFAFPSSTASDLLTVTPQMLTQYLRPDSNETNHLDRPGVVVFVPADMPFMPPTQKATPESRAIYQSR